MVELLEQIIPGADPDLVRPLHKRISARYESIRLKTKVTAVAARDDGLHVTIEGADGSGRGGLRPRAGVRRPRPQRPADRARSRPA